MLAVANAQGVIVKAVGDSGTSTGLQGLTSPMTHQYRYMSPS